MRFFESLAIGVSMYSKIPMPRVEWNEKNMKYAMCFFPLVGVVTGILEVILGNALLVYTSCGTLFFAGVMTLLPVLVNGGIHMDGFLDTMDALNSYGSREKKLEILKDSRTGAFAVIGFGLYLVASLALWSEAEPEMLPVIGAGYVMSRSLSGLSVMVFPSAKKDGLGRTFQEQAHRKRVAVVMVCWFFAALAVMLMTSVQMGAAALCTALLVFWYYHHMAMKQHAITALIAGFLNENPDMTLQTIEGDSTFVKELLTDGKCDIAFLRSESSSVKEFNSIPYMIDYLTAVLPATHPLAKADNLPFEQLRGETFLLFPEHSFINDLCIRECRNAGFEPHIAYTGNRGATLIDLVRNGAGITLMMHHSARQENDSSLAFIPVTPGIYSYISLNYAKEKPLSPQAKSFVRYVKAHKRDF